MPAADHHTLTISPLCSTGKGGTSTRWTRRIHQAEFREALRKGSCSLFDEDAHPFVIEASLGCTVIAQLRSPLGSLSAGVRCGVPPRQRRCRHGTHQGR